MKRWLLAAGIVAASCATGPPRPAAIAMGQDLCAQCRMTIVSQATAAQVAVVGEETKIFDDIGCLRDYMQTVSLPQDAVVYVVDHGSRAWIDARAAVFTHTSQATPMASGLLAHANAATRDADPAARGGVPVSASAMLASPVRSTVP